MNNINTFACSDSLQFFGQAKNTGNDLFDILPLLISLLMFIVAVISIYIGIKNFQKQRLFTTLEFKHRLYQQFIVMPISAKIDEAIKNIEIIFAKCREDLDKSQISFELYYDQYFINYIDSWQKTYLQFKEDILLYVRISEDRQFRDNVIIQCETGEDEFLKRVAFESLANNFDSLLFDLKSNFIEIKKIVYHKDPLQGIVIRGKSVHFEK